jgi:hypothetical protein
MSQCGEKYKYQGNARFFSFSFQFFLCLGGGHFESADQLPQYSMTVQNQSSSGHVGPNIIMDTYKWIMVDLRFEIQ